MRYLLDTHTLLWAARSPAELTKRVREILMEPEAELLISIVVPWEMAIKAGTGKLEHAQEILDNFEDLMTASGYRRLETSYRDVIKSGGLPIYHKDPFDRLLIAQAMELRVPILSCDDIFDRYGVKRIWD